MLCPSCKSDLCVPKTVKVFLGRENDTPASLRMSSVVSFLNKRGNVEREVPGINALFEVGLRVVRTHCLHCNEYLKGVV